MVTQAFTELEQSKLGIHYPNLGFVKNPEPDAEGLSKYRMTEIGYMEKYNMQQNERGLYGVGKRQIRHLVALSSKSEDQPVENEYN